MDSLTPAPLSAENTLSPSLSSIFKAKADDINKSLQDVLQGLREKRITLNHSLTSVPVHPYERLKWQYLDQMGLSAIPFDQLPAPSAFDLTAVSKEISNISAKFSDGLLSRFESLTAGGIQDPNVGNVFSALSGDSYVIDDNRMSKHLMFLETVQHIPMGELERDPSGVTQKILNEFVKAYGS